MKFDDNNPIKYAYEYPDLSVENFMETASVHVSRLAGLGADFDGDKRNKIKEY